MTTFKAICIKDEDIIEGFKLIRGKEYTVSEPKNNLVTVLDTVWVRNVPLDLFAGIIPFTKD